MIILGAKNYILLGCLLATLSWAQPVLAQSKKTTTTQKNSSAQQKKSTTPQKKNSPQKSNTKPKQDNSIQGLKNQREEIKKNIQKQEKALQANKADVKKRLQALLELNTQIGDQKKRIADTERDIAALDEEIKLLEAQLETLTKQLEERKEKYVKSLRYFTRHHSFEDKLMFIFSAHNFAEAYRRMRFMKEYASFQRAQGELLKKKQAQVEEKKQQIEAKRAEVARLLEQNRREQTKLEGQHAEQQKMVKSLESQQKTIQGIISDQKKKDAALNAQIEKMIQEEVRRQQEEARKRAEAEAAAKKREEERKRREAEEAKRRAEEQKRLEAARAEEQRLKDLAAKEQTAQAAQRAKEAEANRFAMEGKAAADLKNYEAEQQKSREAASGSWQTANDQKLSANFEANKGRLPVPITGQYRIVSHFGQYNVDGLKNVTLDNKGINIMGTSGCQARSIFDGEVSGVANVGGTWLVLVRHGRYISVYCNLKAVSVSKGQKVSARQVLGTVASDNILQFQLRKETAKLNPELWIGR